MAAVPDLFKRTVQLDATNTAQERVSSSPSAFGAGIGRATQNLGAGVAKVADAIDYKKQLTDDADARKAHSDYRRAQADLLRDPNSGLLNQTGGNGVDLTAEGDARLAKLQEQFGKDLSPRARRLYDAKVSDARDQAHEVLLNHDAKETRSYIVGSRQATIAGYLEDAVLNANNDELFQRNLGLALREQDALGKLQGASPAEMLASGNELISTAMLNRIVAIADTDPERAAAELENSRDVLSAADQHKLDTGMKQLILDSKVNKFMGGFTGVVDPTKGPDPYLAAVTRAESGGSATAANSRSSAIGPHQFLKATYLGEVAKLRKAGGAKWAEGLTEAQILSTRTDRAKENEVFTSFRKGNQAQIRALGFEVNPLNEYIFHHFGDTGGRKVLRANRERPSVSIEELFGAAQAAGVVKANPWMHRGMTAAEMHDGAANLLGVDPVTEGGKPFFSAREAYAAAGEITDPKVRMEVYKRIDQMSARQTRAQTEDQKSARKEAWDQYTKTGNAEVSMELKARMGEGGFSSFKAAVHNDATDTSVTNPSTWKMLTQLSQPDFLKVDLFAHQSELSQADFRTFVRKQEALKAAVAGGAQKEADKKFAFDYGKAHTQVDDIYASLVDGTKTAKLTQEQLTRKVDFQRQLDTLISEFYDDKGRGPTLPEVRELATTLALPITLTDHAVAGFIFNGESEASLFDAANRNASSTFEVTLGIDSVPAAARAQIAKNLENVTGSVPSNKAIAEVYEQRRMIDAGLPATSSIADVPDSIIAFEKERDPSVTDDEIVEQFMLFLTKG